MRAFDLFEKVGRDLQHIEDLIYIDGPDGAMHALERIRQLLDKPDTLSIKWDGSPAIKFGRDEIGTFHFGDKYAKEMITTKRDMQNYYTAKAKGGMDAGRKDFMQRMITLHGVFENATPESFTGFIHADLMWWKTPELNENNEFVFAPNTVRYFVDADSDLGNRIARSSVGAAAISYMQDFGSGASPIGEKWKDIKQGELLLLPPVNVKGRKPNIPQNALKQMQVDIKRDRAVIEEFIDPMPGLSDIRAIIYNFVNRMAAKGKTTNLANEFPDWVQSNEKISDNKKEKIQQKIEINERGMRAMFSIVEMFSAIKKDIINQLEQPTLKDVGIRAELVSGVQGGEGFVDAPKGSAPLKFVDRETFSMANFAKGQQ